MRPGMQCDRHLLVEAVSDEVIGCGFEEPADSGTGASPNLGPPAIARVARSAHLLNGQAPRRASFSWARIISRPLNRAARSNDATVFPSDPSKVDELR
eukprot:7382410-Prymnesium_polylepis.3